MAIPIRNTVFDKIKEANRLTDVELFKSLIKDGHVIADDRFNKILTRFRDTWLDHSLMDYQRRTQN